MLKLVESFLTNNPCYKKGQKITVKGLMLHSVGCAQPSASVFIKNWNQSSYSRACVHGFIDGNDGTVYQTLPWDCRGWHCGGAANNTHIGVEMCEPSCIKYAGGSNFTCSDMAKARETARKTYEAAVALFAMLCGRFSLDPMADGVILSHSEGSKRGSASAHADPEHLWTQLSLPYTMDGFRCDVKKAMAGGAAAGAEPSVMTEADIYAYFKAQGMTDCGAAGLMGNLYAESGLRADNLQNSFEKKLGMDDEAYTAAVDSGAYGNFVRDSAGYGIAQWTFWSRKQNLLSFAKEKGASIGDLRMQCEFLMKELSESYKPVLTVLKGAGTVRQASDAVLLGFERPADQGRAVQEKRASYGEAYFERYAGKTACLPYKVRVSIPDLNIRKGPGTGYGKTGKYTGAGVFTIVEECGGEGASRWGLLKSYGSGRDGWISLDYAERITE
ncbi:MAG: phage tail tip lysozyme [Ruminococcus flavefaciens]|nr:phage tail tip lysozyme [Ruminococcus flavefaciens]